MGYGSYSGDLDATLRRRRSRLTHPVAAMKGKRSEFGMARISLESSFSTHRRLDGDRVQNIELELKFRVVFERS